MAYFRSDNEQRSLRRSCETCPNVKQMEKASPIKARDFDLVFASVTSLMIAL